MCAQPMLGCKGTCFFGARSHIMIKLLGELEVHPCLKLEKGYKVPILAEIYVALQELQGMFGKMFDIDICETF